MAPAESAANQLWLIAKEKIPREMRKTDRNVVKMEGIKPLKMQLVHERKLIFVLYGKVTLRKKYG